MTRLRSIQSAEELCVHLRFHITAGMNPRGITHRLDELMRKTFGEEQARVAASEKTLVYRINRPLIPGLDANQEFFNNLLFVMNSTSPLEPHFTQSKEIA